MSIETLFERRSRGNSEKPSRGFAIRAHILGDVMVVMSVSQMWATPVYFHLIVLFW